MTSADVFSSYMFWRGESVEWYRKNLRVGRGAKNY